MLSLMKVLNLFLVICSEKHPTELRKEGELLGSPPPKEKKTSVRQQPLCQHLKFIQTKHSRGKFSQHWEKVYFDQRKHCILVENDAQTVTEFALFLSKHLWQRPLLAMTSEKQNTNSGLSSYPVWDTFSRRRPTYEKKKGRWRKKWKRLWCRPQTLGCLIGLSNYTALSVTFKIKRPGIKGIYFASIFKLSWLTSL